MVKKREKCKFCGKSRFTYSTEQKGNVWISKKICEFCGKIVGKQTLRK